MGFKSQPTPAPVVADNAVTPPAPKVVEASKPAVRPEVKGQVAMHAIMKGYDVASRLAATLAASPEKVEEKLHKLALDVAAKVEAYTFKGE